MKTTARLVLMMSIVGFLLGLPPSGSANTPQRQIRVWPTNGTINWATAPILWFGQATNNSDYVDVRIAYDSTNLYLYATIVDYYLWYDPTGTSDPRTYDAFGIYLDTTGELGSVPDGQDYFFVSGYRFFPKGNDARWHRQGRGTGAGWDESWNPTVAWTDSVGDRYYNSGPNNNSDLDAGWATTLTIPWATMGRSGPPASGTTWGMGMNLYNRDDLPPAGAEPNEPWPETFNVTSPSTWGGIVFNPSTYAARPVANPRTVTIRLGLNANFVQDAYAGGGGDCSGGIKGGGTTPHPTGDLFVQNEADVSDFPCFSKSYLNFDLSAIPPEKVVQSASLTLYLFGNSDPSQAPPSYIQVFGIRDAWDETALTWNNAPLAAVNYPGTWVNPVPAFPGWPGIPYQWDVSQLVASSHASGQSANLALYSADLGYNTGKYFASSDAGEWDANGRPTLVVTYGDPPLTNGYSIFLPFVSR